MIPLKAYFLFLFIFSGVFPAFSDDLKIPTTGQGYDFANNGKTHGPLLNEVFTAFRPQAGRLIKSEFCLQAAKQNYRYLDGLSRPGLKAEKFFEAGNLGISANDLRKTSAAIVQWLQEGETELSKQFDFFQIKGEDNMGNVQFTGYFTPLIDARKKADAKFRFPLFSQPRNLKGTVPSRAEIDHNGALSGKGLELAYTASLLDNYFLQVQGSGFLQFEDSAVRMVGFAGSNGMKYNSLGRLLVSKGAIPAEKISLRAIRSWFEKHPDDLVPMLNQNPSYVFFQWRSGKVTGAAGVPLVAEHSFAVDPRYIPLGACLLAQIPVLDREGNLIGHHWRIGFAHDIGGAIKGPGHLDLYHGLGREAGDRAGDLHHYGRVWLLKAKSG